MKQTTKVILISASILLLIGLVILGIHLFGLGTQSVVQVGDYICPSGYRCAVTPILECTSPQTNSKVILRTNSPNFNQESFLQAGIWIAIDTNNDGALEGYVKGTTTSGCMKDSQSVVNIYKNKGIGVDNIYVYNSKVYVCVSATQSYQYVSTTLAETSISPKEPYKTNGQEKYSGNLYSCGRNIYINSVKKETLSWSQDNPTSTGGLRGNTYTIYANDKISSDGTGTFKVDYSNTVYTPPVTTCTAENGQVLSAGESICLDQYTSQKCTSPPTTEKNYALEGQTCKNGAISQAYNVTIKIDRNIISYGEKFEVDFALTGTDSNKNVEIIASLLKGSQVMSTLTQNTGNSPFDAGKTHFSLESPPIGYYTLRITFNSPDGNFKREFNVQVTDSLTLVMKTPNTIQFDNNNIVASLESYKGGTYKALTNYELESTYNGRTVYQKTTQSGGLGILKFYYDLQGDGTLRIRARGNDETGLWTQWTDYLEITVRKASILISAPDLPTDVCIGSYTMKFETKDSTGNYIDTSNQITVDKPIGGTDTVSSLTGSNGKYSFSYNFVNGGAYIIRITSSNTDIGTSQLNGGQGQIVNILTGDACGGSGGGANWTLYLIIGVAILSVLFIVYFMFFYKRKK